MQDGDWMNEQFLLTHQMVEGVGFEPTEVFTFAGFQDQCFRPLSHPSEQNRTQTLSNRRQV